MAEQQRPQVPNRTPASPLEIVGFDGAPPILAGPSDLQRPGVVNIQDTTQNSYAAMESAIVQSRQAVDSVSQSSAQVAQTAIQAASRVADFSGVIEPVMTGIELWRQTKQAEKEAQNLQLGSQFEQRINDLAVELAFNVEQQTTEQGYFTTRAAALQEAHKIAQEFREAGLGDEAITPVLKIIQSAASTGIREDISRFRQVATDERNKAADQAFSALRFQLAPLIGSLSSARSQTQMDVYVSEMYGQIDAFFSQYNIDDPQLRLQVQTAIVQEAGEQALLSGQRNGALANRLGLLTEVSQQVNQLTEEFNQTGNYGLYQTALRRLDALYADVLGSGTVVGLASDPLQELGYQRELNDYARAESEYQDEYFRTMLEADPTARQYRQQTAVGLAINAFNNGATGMGIIADTEHELHAEVKAQYDLFVQDHEKYLELYNRQLEYEETVQRGVVEVNNLLDSLSPTERLGAPTTITQAGILSYEPELQRVIVNALERGRISEETYREYQRLFTIQNEIAAGTIQRELRNIQTRWEPWSVDISNPQNTTALQTAMSAAQEGLQTISSQVSAQRSRPPGFP